MSLKFPKRVWVCSACGEVQPDADVKWCTMSPPLPYERRYDKAYKVDAHAERRWVWAQVSLAFDVSIPMAQT